MMIAMIEEGRSLSVLVDFHIRSSGVWGGVR